MSGFSEEFFFRAFIQTRFSTLLKSKVSGVLIGSLLYGLLHIPNIMQWYPSTTLVEAFCRAFFVQTFMGIIFGVLWERTRSLIPCVFVHSGVNGLNNLGWIISKLGL
ncbi:MAG: lysostaphin resistance A-like protein [Candidatus Methanofastidiosia archaeon]